MYTKGPTIINDPSTDHNQYELALKEYAIPRLLSSAPILFEILWNHTIAPIPNVIGETMKNNKQ